jgi:hypothetical protein
MYHNVENLTMKKIQEMNYFFASGHTKQTVRNGKASRWPLYESKKGVKPCSLIP